jgi:hypothetical protein
LRIVERVVRVAVVEGGSVLGFGREVEAGMRIRRCAERARGRKGRRIVEMRILLFGGWGGCGRWRLGLQMGAPGRSKRGFSVVVLMFRGFSDLEPTTFLFLSMKYDICLAHQRAPTKFQHMISKNWG